VGGAADLGEWNPDPPTGGEAHTDLLCAVKNLRSLPPRTAGGPLFFFVFFFFLIFSLNFILYFFKFPLQFYLFIKNIIPFPIYNTIL
jgi:hypothetical protein